jgi:transposase
MGTPAYSLDLRQRIVALSNAGTHSPIQVAAVFSVSRSSVDRYVLQERKTGDLTPRPRLPSKKAKRNNPLVQTTLLELVEKYNDWTLVQYCNAIDERLHIRMSVASMCTLLQKLDQRRKKKISMHPSATRQPYYRRGKISE